MTDDGAKQSKPARSAGRAASSKERTSAKRSVVLDQRKTSVSVEDAFWDALREIAIEQRESLSDLIRAIHAEAPARQSLLSHSSVRTSLLCRSDQ
jgi:predicted DNA-binding ribbon-helix-helix protein